MMSNVCIVTEKEEKISVWYMVCELPKNNNFLEHKAGSHAIICNREKLRQDLMASRS